MNVTRRCEQRTQDERCRRQATGDEQGRREETAPTARDRRRREWQTGVTDGIPLPCVRLFRFCLMMELTE